MTDVLVHRQTFVQFHLADTEERVSPGSGSIVVRFATSIKLILGKLGTGIFLFFSYVLQGSRRRSKSVSSTWSWVGGNQTSNCRVCTGACAQKGGGSRSPLPSPRFPPLDPPPPEARRLLLPLPLSISH